MNPGTGEAAMMGVTTHQSKLRILNSLQTTMRMWIEPWGDEISLAPGKTVALEAAGPAGGCLTVEQASECIIVYGWPGSILKVFDGEVLVRNLSVPAPRTPPQIASAR